MDYIEVLEFWFGDPDAPKTDDMLNAMWFESDEALDKQIREQFLPYVSMAGEGKLNQWLSSPQGTLATIVLLDQFSRRVYRGLSAAFRYDEFALAVCKRGLAEAQDLTLPTIQRAFFYMPLQHSEHMEDQEEALFRFSQLCSSAGLDEAGLFENIFRHARNNFDVIKRFGRFPSRNASLGRLSTEAELQWLAGGGAKLTQ
ncbi:membrane protein [Grimontia sp. AD028]|uniref:Transmembrane protein n=1 Tax=Grimontia indica TaxID=1056512 RepID=R1GS43_9GAMM|nr:MULTISPECIES: DUF924 family protein [Grimontia]EOD79038.1 putative transmembrane protein [Grimontia indica]KKD59437.1 membrane protein [Grimontia sp. AD028]